MRKKTVVIPLIITLVVFSLLMSLPRGASAQDPDETERSAAQAQEVQEQRHALDDGVADTPFEVDSSHHGTLVSDSEDDDEEQQHGGDEGHLPASSENVELIGQLTLSNVEPGQISDVGTLGNYAYLGSFSTPNCDKGGVYIVDISNPANPEEVGFIPTAPGSFVGEGVQAISVKTKAFKGDILVINNEICDLTDEQIGGFSIYDVTDPSNPQPLVIGAGDTDPGGTFSTANQIHSAFAWQQGKRAFVVIVDDEELEDVDIFEITDPRNPVMVAEVGLEDWPDAQNDQSDGTGVFSASFFHDVVVKRVRGNWLMLLSYWDAGYIVLNVNDPANPVFVNDTDFSDPDPLTGFSPAEGNAHQSEFTYNNQFIIGTDEDFSPYRLTAEITSGPFTGETFTASQGSDVPQVDQNNPLAGPTYFVGLGCDPAEVPVAPSPDAIAVVERGVCGFTVKAQIVQAAGYAGGIVFNNEGLDRCEALVNMLAQADIPFLFVGRATGFKILSVFDPATYVCPGGPAAPAIGTVGSNVSITAEFDGWGYVHLFDAKTLKEIDTYAISEALDPEFAQDFGDLSVHEVAVEPNSNFAYLSYYAGGLRVIEFNKHDGIREIGHYIAEDGNNFWGVQIFHPQNGDHAGETLVLASDRDSGLWIFKCTFKP